MKDETVRACGLAALVMAAASVVLAPLNALARMQTGQQAALAELLNTVELSGEGNTVTLSFAVPAQFFERLKNDGVLPFPGPSTQQPPAVNRRPAPVRPAA